MSDQDDNSSSDSEQSQASHASSSVEIVVSIGERNKRLEEQVRSLQKRLKQRNVKKDEKKETDHRSSTNTTKVTNLSLSLTKNPKLFSI